MMVDYFHHASPYDYLKPETSAAISSYVSSTHSLACEFERYRLFDGRLSKSSLSIDIRCGFTDTCALVVAMCYLERMRTRQKDAFDDAHPKGTVTVPPTL